MGFLSILSYAHKLIQERVSPGETVVDATAGNGVDTLFLAKCVGPAGSVHAFDVQEQALLRTRQRLEQEPAEHAPVQLHHCSHALLQEKLPAAAKESLAAVMFNLGYLPGDDHQTVTQADSTVAALQQAVEWLRKGGIVTIILYTGHEGGEQEAEAVRAWAQQLSQKQYQVLEYRFMNQKNHPPYCIAVEKR